MGLNRNNQTANSSINNSRMPLTLDSPSIVPQAALTVKGPWESNSTSSPSAMSFEMYIDCRIFGCFRGKLECKNRHRQGDGRRAGEGGSTAGWGCSSIRERAMYSAEAVK